MKTKYNTNYHSFFIVTTIIIAVFSFFYLLSIQNHTTPKYYELSDNWDITWNGKTYHNVSLQDFEFHGVKKGDTVSFCNRIPKEVVGNQTMIFNTYLSSVNIILNDGSIYQYAMQHKDADQIIGNGCHFVIIPRNSSGKEFHINLKVKENNAFTNMERITFVPTTQAFSYYAQQKSLIIYISIFLFILGITLSITSIFTHLSNPNNHQLTYIGLFSFFMGIWSMCNMKVLHVLNINFTACSNLEYLSLFCATIPLVLLLSTTRPDFSPKNNLWIRFILLLFVIFICVTTTLHFTKTVHFSQFLTLFHIMVALTLLIFVFLSLRNKYEKNFADKIMSFGFYLLCFSFALDLARFNLQKYFMPNDIRLYDSFIPFGTLAFIILLIYSYMLSTLTMIHSKAEQDILSYIAYHDNLCNIFNRAMCDKTFSELDQTNASYSIINLDLNGLKKINDTHGHEAGDKLLIAFSQILTKAFENVGTCYRMGGDEFIVVVLEPNEKFIPSSIERMSLLEKERSAELGFTIHASYGIASKTEVPEQTALKVNSLADKRMYQMKTNYYQS